MSRLALLPQEHPYKAFITCPEGDENSRNLNKFILATSVAHLLLIISSAESILITDDFQVQTFAGAIVERRA